MRDDLIASKFRYRFYCTHRRWIGKPDPAGFGRFTHDTNDRDGAAARFKSSGDRVDRVEIITI